MGSICHLTVDLKRAAWRAKRVVVATALETSSAKGLAFLRARVDRVVRVEGLDTGAELRVFSGLQWYRQSHAGLLRAGVVSYVEEHYTGGIPLEEIRPGDRVLLFLDDEPAPEGFPPGSVFLSFEAAFDRGAREAELDAALRDGPYGDYHHLLKIPKDGCVRLPDGLVVTFLGHAHKRPMVGGPQKEWVTLRLALGGIEESLDLAHHVDPDGKEEWDHKEWSGYKIEARGMSTSEATIVVRKL